jgi:cbb3-type cytochrome oxidase subunit 3
LTALIFAGDMLVMAFMIGLVAWLALGSSRGDLDRAARLPLDDVAGSDLADVAGSDLADVAGSDLADVAGSDLGVTGSDLNG